MKRKNKKQETGLADAPGRKRIMPVEVQQKEFRLSFRGYNERDVDEFLDEITEELTLLVEEAKQLRERASGSAPALALGLVPGSEDAEGAAARARDEAVRIVQEAREEAASIVARAREEAASLEGSAAAAVGGAGAALGPFLSREREFLQGLASLIQEHAGSVKSMARAARDREIAVPPSSIPDTAAAEPTSAQGGPEEPVPTTAADQVSAPSRPILSAPQIPRKAATPTIEPAEAEPAPSMGAAPAAERAVTPVDAQRITIPEEPGSTGSTASPADESAGRTTSGSVPPPEGDDRSLRELFWGED